MKRPSLVVGLASVVAVTLGVAAGVSATAGSSGGSGLADALTVVSALGKAPSNADRLPSGISYDGLGTEGLVVDSVRTLGTDERATYRVGLDATGKLCLIVTLDDQQRTTGSTCAPPGAVEKAGLLLGLQGNVSSGSVEQITYLLPDSASIKDLAAPWHAVGGNVAVGYAAELEAQRPLVIGREDGSARPIELHR